MPAAAVIPALLAYTKVVAVKKLVVGFLQKLDGLLGFGRWDQFTAYASSHKLLWPSLVGVSGRETFTLRKTECSKQAIALNELAWDNKIGLLFYFVGCSRSGVMIDEDGWGHRYSRASGEILRPLEDQLLRKHLPSTFPSIKNESWGIEDDQIPS